MSVHTCWHPPLCHGRPSWNPWTAIWHLWTSGSLPFWFRMLILANLDVYQMFLKSPKRISYCKAIMIKVIYFLNSLVKKSPLEQVCFNSNMKIGENVFIFCIFYQNYSNLWRSPQTMLTITNVYAFLFQAFLPRNTIGAVKWKGNKFWRCLFW